MLRLAGVALRRAVLRGALAAWRAALATRREALAGALRAWRAWRMHRRAARLCIARCVCRLATCRAVMRLSSVSHALSPGLRCAGHQR